MVAINIELGQYLVGIEKTGFKKAEVRLTLDVNAKADVGQIRLEVGQLTEVLSINQSIVYLGIQRDLPARFSLDLSYAGNHAVHLMEQRKPNAVAAGTFVQNPNLSQSVNYRNDALRPYYGCLTAVETRGYSSYNAMMFRLGRRFADNLAVNFNYTWSTVMDLVDNDSDTIINPFNIRQNWAPAG